MQNIISEIIPHFCKVISCEKCDCSFFKKLLRDNNDNIPQPGYVGSNYPEKRILLVGQNPGISTKNLENQDRIYINVLKTLCMDQNTEAYWNYHNEILNFITNWPVHQKHFPLDECDLTLEDIAYSNIVRCRTIDNDAPSAKMVDNCIREHFYDLLNILDPKFVIFIGKWAYDRASHLLPSTVKHSFINRSRSLSREDRNSNRSQVVELVDSYIEDNR